MIKRYLTSTENFSLTRKLTKNLQKLNNLDESKHQKDVIILGELGSRLIGFIATPLTCLIDALAHAVFAVGKFAVGVFVTPYNFITKNINQKYGLPDELGLSSALLHVLQSVKNFASASFIPFVAIAAPSLTHAVFNNSQTKNIEELKKENDCLLKRIQGLEIEFQILSDMKKPKKSDELTIEERFNALCTKKSINIVQCKH